MVRAQRLLRRPAPTGQLTTVRLIESWKARLYPKYRRLSVRCARAQDVIDCGMAYALVGGIASALMVILALVARVPTYHVAPGFLIPVLWTAFFLRRILNLHPVSYGLVASAMLLHMLGAFGYYQQSPLPFSFDILVHYYFA